MRLSKQVFSVTHLVAAVAIALVSIQCGSDDGSSPGDGGGDKISRPFEYSGFSSPEYSSYTKTSRPCPPFCVQPITPSPGVNTVGELELLDFLRNKVKNSQGVLVDARIPAWFRKGTIPGAVNIPFTLFSPDKNPYLDKILAVLGAKRLSDGTWDFANAQELLLFCNGPWCGQSPRAIRNLITIGYPTAKLHYYRGGMQAWLALGFNTIRMKK